MEYIIPIVLVVLVVGGFVTFLALNATRKRGPAAGGEGPPGIGADRTPLGDTSEHADAAPAAGKRPAADPDAAAHVGRRGEGEGAERLEFEGRRPQTGDGEGDAARAERLRREQARPASERLADRDA
jgi:hypothetical protein